jgi:hypothetical protein
MNINFRTPGFANDFVVTDVTGTIVVTKDITGAVEGAMVMKCFLARPGAVDVDVTDFVTVASAVKFDPTPGVKTFVLFSYDGGVSRANCWQGENLIPTDVAPPTVRQVAIREPGELFVRLDKPVSGTTAGFTITKNASAVTKTSISGTSSRKIAVSGTFVFGNVATLAYSPGDTVDTAAVPNALAAFAARTADNLLPNPAAVPTWAYFSNAYIVGAHAGVEKTGGPLYSWGEFVRSTLQLVSGKMVQFRNFDSINAQKKVVLTTATAPGYFDGYGIFFDNNGAVSHANMGGSGLGPVAKSNGEDWWQIWHMGTYLSVYRSEDGVNFFLVPELDSRNVVASIADVAYYIGVGISTNGALQDFQILPQ